jgi:hypothetical protein
VTRPHHDTDLEKTFRTHPVSRGWADADGQPIEVLCFANGDELRLTYGDEELPLVHHERHGYWSAVTTTRADSLVLEALRAGEVVARDILRPRGEPVRIDASAWTAPHTVVDRCVGAGIAADRVLQIECTLRDEHEEVACGERVVTAVVDGGALLGLENGDLSDNTPYTADRRRTLDGRLIVFVQSGASATLTLSSPGLPDVRMEWSS